MLIKTAPKAASNKEIICLELKLFKKQFQQSLRNILYCILQCPDVDWIEDYPWRCERWRWHKGEHI